MHYHLLPHPVELMHERKNQSATLCIVHVSYSLEASTCKSNKHHTNQMLKTHECENI